jgi:hypothetical protein
MKTVSFSRHTILPRVWLPLALSRVASHQAPLPRLFLNMSELGPSLRFLCKPSGLFHRFRTESLVSDSSPFSFLK